jgi:hypothetical protein
VAKAVSDLPELPNYIELASLLSAKFGPFVILGRAFVSKANTIPYTSLSSTSNPSSRSIKYSKPLSARKISLLLTVFWPRPGSGT